MIYRYELHCHTQEGSKCSKLPIKEMVEFYHRMGYAGICITDHFSGMTRLPDEAPWDERVMHYYNIYEEARKAGEKYGLSVFFGFEHAFVPDINYLSRPSGAHFVVLNITKEWLLENKSAFCGRITETLTKIREAGGFVIHAHPFLEAEWIEYIQLMPRAVDAVEILNARCSEFENSMARHYRQAYGLLETAGSDCHSSDQRILSGLETPSPCLSAEDLIAAIKASQAQPFTIKRED